MLGVIVNTATVLLGSLIGLICRKGIPEKVEKAVMTAIGLCTLYIGVDGALSGENVLVLILSMIIGTALGGMAVAGGSLLAANGGRAANGECSENTPVSRYELGLQQTIAEQGSHIRLLEADKYTDQKIVDVYNAINPQINAIKDELRNIAVYQATNTATISCLGNQVNGIQAVLNGLTKTVIPKSNVCPEPMDRYNSWTAPAAGSTTT